MKAKQSDIVVDVELKVSLQLPDINPESLVFRTTPAAQISPLNDLPTVAIEQGRCMLDKKCVHVATLSVSTVVPFDRNALVGLVNERLFARMGRAQPRVTVSR